MPAHFLVAAGAEGPDAVFCAGAVGGDPQHADLAIMPGVQDGFGHLVDGLGAEGVADIGPVEGDAGDALGFVIGDVVIGFDLLPVGQAHEICGFDLGLLFGCGRHYHKGESPSVWLAQMVVSFFHIMQWSQSYYVVRVGGCCSICELGTGYFTTETQRPRVAPRH